jgi:predicted nucleotidyltransferase/DNA-binding XRE family transcriptional regulator
MTIRDIYDAVDERSGSLLRQARRTAGLSQAELARRAGVTQSVVSAYESAARQPSLPMLDRLVSATGLELELRVRRRTSRLSGLIGARLWARRKKVNQLAASYGLSNLRVFGSVARGEETEESDVDLLVDVTQGVGLIGLARAQRELEQLLGARVDLVPASDLKPGDAESVLAEAVPI